MRVAEKWDGRMPGVAPAPAGDWEQRARRAEAEAALARTQAVAAMLQAEARTTQLERELDAVTGSTSWRATAPLRRLKAAPPGAMIAFGCPITAPEVYERRAGRGIAAAAEPGSARFPFRATSSIFASNNLILDRAAACDDLEALVLVHQDTELTDDEFCAKVRAVLADPDVAVAGCIGALGVRSIAWWEGSVTWASFIHRYGELGGGDLPGFAWDGGDATARTRGRARSTWSTASCSCCRRGPCGTCASTSRSGRCTATTSTSACRPGPPGARW